MVVDEQCRTWMQAALNGDTAAYRLLLEAIGPWLRALHAQHCSPADADDLMQETLLAIHQKRHTYDPAQPFMPWAAAIARYKRIDFYRHRQRLRETELNDDAPLPALNNNESRMGEHREQIEKLLAQLPREQAQVIRTVKLEGHSVHEAALKLSRSLSWVKVNVHRGLKTLAEKVQQSSL